VTARVRFACAALGEPCEWALEAESADEVSRRFVDHARCAHAIAPVPADLDARVRAAVVPL
jgi:predicted small metal-binding protein